MFCINNEKNKSAVILNPERSEWVSRSHVTSVEPVVNDRAKTKRYSAKRDLYGHSLRSTLKMTAFAFLLSLNISESLAGKCISDGITTNRGTIEGTTTACESCGLNCNWELSNDGKLTISAKDNATNVVMRDFDRVSDPNAPDTVTTTNKVISSAPWGKTYANLSQITSVEVGKNITNIGKDAFFYADQITDVSGMENVTTVGQTAFCHAKELANIDIPSVETIGMSAFNNASSLTSITIPEGVTSIRNSAFYGASSLNSITIPDSVTSIGTKAFNNASGLTSITIPDSVTTIGSNAFQYASSLNNIMCKGDATSCAAMVNALPSNLRNKVSYPTDKTSCEGASTSLYVWDSENEKCGRRNEKQCNSVAKYYYNSSANNGAGQCQLLPKTESACTGNGLAWNNTSSKCTNTNYTPSQEANNINTGGDDIGDISGDFNPADCYNNGQVPYDNKCWDEYPFARKRWTPAEAAEWLHDGNDNFVVITFKK